MSMTNTSETNLLKLIFNNTTWANIGDATGIVGSTAAGSLYISLHTADPGETGDQTTSEIAYTSYVRVAVARTTGGFTVSGTTQVANAATVSFPACTGSSGTATYFAVGRASSGAGEIIVSGAITSPGSGLAISTGITPSFAAGALVATAD